MITILMGVSGAGKSTIGKLLAQQTEAAFIDADAFHSDSNKAKMTAGLALEDGDREPWLQELNHQIRGWTDRGKNAVLACSTLKESYRVTLMRGLPRKTVALVWLDGSREMIAARLAIRQHDFMNSELLDSQLTTLEPPSDAFHLINDKTPLEIVAAIQRRFSL